MKTELERVEMLLELVEQRIIHWRERLTMFQDSSYLTEGQVLHELEVIQTQVKDAKRSLPVD